MNYTYQDWLKVANESEEARMNFIWAAIGDHKTSPAYIDACVGEDYYNGFNTTIKRLQKLIYNAAGQAVPDLISANHKLATRFFYREVTQTISTLLGNGVSWSPKKKTGDALGKKKDFDGSIIDIATYAQVEGSCFGFWNFDHIDVFPLTQFKPLYDTENGGLFAGFRFWQLASDKPMRVTCYEVDGYTDYLFSSSGVGEVMGNGKRYYIEHTKTSEADGTIIYAGENYPAFPIIPCFCNKTKTSEILPLRPTIDAYDLISSGYANDIDDANIIYWTITNAGGMDDEDLIKFVDKLRKVHAAQVDSDQQIQANSVDISYEGREAILDRLEAQLYKDSMTVNTYDMASGSTTATEIIAAYTPLNQKLDLLEPYISDFIHRLLFVAGIEDDDPTYDRSGIINKSEEIDNLMKSALYLDDEYLTEKLMTLFGDKDRIDEYKKRKAENDVNRLTRGKNGDTESEQAE